MERAEIERLGDALYLAMCDRRMVAPLTGSMARWQGWARAPVIPL